MININLPEAEEKRCDRCGRKIEKPSFKKLIHWPNDKYKKNSCLIITGEKIKAFSYWYYLCQWCKGADTRRIEGYKKRQIAKQGKEA